MWTPHKSQKDTAVSEEDRQRQRRSERYIPQETSQEEGGTLWQKLWKHPEKEEKPLERHQIEEERAMVSEKQGEKEPTSHSQEREQHIKRAEHITPYIPGPKWKGSLQRRWQNILQATGFKNKTLWDILSLQAIVALALVFIQQSFGSQQAQKERERYLNNSLDSYIAAMTELMLKKDYNTNEQKLLEGKFGIEQAKSVGILKILEGEKEKQQRAIAFLRGSNFLNPKDGRGIFNSANLAEINLRGVELTNTDLRDADFRKATLNEVVLSTSDLTGAKLNGAKLKGAYLYGANLTKANLIGTDLSGAELVGAKLLCPQESKQKQCIDLTTTELKGANLTGADLRGVYRHEPPDPSSPKISLNEYDDTFQNTTLCQTTMPDGKLSNRNCPKNK